MFNCAAGREEHCKQISLACVGRARSVSATMGLPPLTGVRAFLVYTAQAPGCSAGELFNTDPGLRALPRSMQLRFRFLGTPQRRRLGWACILCPSQVRAAQVTGCLASALSPGGWCVLSPPPSQLLSFRGAPQERHLRCAVCLFWEIDF